MAENARADIRALMDRETGRGRVLALILLHPGLQAVLLYRLSRWLHLHGLGPLAAMVTYLSSVLTGAQLSPRAEIGPGLVVYHPHGLVVGAGAVIGSRCTLVHGNVVGQLEGGGDRPTIGDEFYAGTGAKILGRVTIGSRVRVGANAVVVQSLPDGVTVGVRPASVLSARDVPASDPEASTPAVALNELVAVDPVSRQEIVRRLGPVLTRTTARAAEAPVIAEETGLLGAGIGLDSIEVLSLISAIEEEFQVTVDEGDLSATHLKTVGSLVSFIQERLAA